MSNIKPPIFRIPDSDAHDRISALFLGPRAENADRLMQYFTTVVQGQENARKAYFPNDTDFIPQDVRESDAFIEKSQQLDDALGELLLRLGKYSIPFYSPRYSAHMSTDQSLPAILGYLSTMFYNPNNVAFEASPFTTQLEILVGQQLCQMLGYNLDPASTDLPVAWGHITCDGSVANLESVWVSRNLKFYPLSLRDAMSNELSFIADSFQVSTCKGEQKLLTECTTWELLNLTTTTVVEIPERLITQYHLSSNYLDSVMNQYLIQTTNKDYLMKKWGIDNEPVIFLPSTKHYSWPKAAAIAGVGSVNAVNVPIDTNARMNTDKLKELLLDYASKELAVYEVVAVMGTTEEGAVDRLTEIIQLRDDLRAEGLSFVVHADCAWGGYFCSMLGSRTPGIPEDWNPDNFVPYVGLSLETQAELEALGQADSITIDPHKAGYVPYPAGGLCYKDGRTRFLVTWTAPYINQGVSSGESIGVYGVEGSKPGAAAASVYLAHQVIGLNPDGHGTLLGEATFTCRRFSSIWAAMSNKDTDFLVVPFNPLPAEKDGSDVEVQKTFIRERIIAKTNAELVEDQEAMTLLNQLGSDLNINAFACNFKYSDGRVNEDIMEANWLNRRIFERLSVTDPDEDPLSIPFYITSTVFAQADYGECADEFKRRLQLKGNQDLFVLRNVVMSPFTTTREFINELAAIFQQVLEEEIVNVRRRNEPTPEQLVFLVQGTDKPHFVNMPKFHMASGRRQFIFNGDMSPQDLEKLRNIRDASSDLPRIRTIDEKLLDDITEGSSFEAELVQPDGTAVGVTVSNVHIVRKRSLDTEDLDSTYPELMPFYLYGTDQQQHIDHMLLFAPNIQVTFVNVTLNPPLSADLLGKGVIAIAQNVHERSQQPFPPHADIDSIFIFGNDKKELVVKIYNDPFPAVTMDPIPIDDVINQGEIASGTITLGDQWFVDSDGLNSDMELAVKAPFEYDRSGKMSLGLKGRWVKAVNGFHKQLSQ